MFPVLNVQSGDVKSKWTKILSSWFLSSIDVTMASLGPAGTVPLTFVNSGISSKYACMVLSYKVY